ncbi:hypothetical protein AMTRI_Chr11g98500 [Amborella trichopoda]
MKKKLEEKRRKKEGLARVNQAGTGPSPGLRPWFAVQALCFEGRAWPIARPICQKVPLLPLGAGHGLQSKPYVSRVALGPLPAQSAKRFHYSLTVHFCKGLLENAAKKW